MIHMRKDLLPTRWQKSDGTAGCQLMVDAISDDDAPVDASVNHDTVTAYSTTHINGELSFTGNNPSGIRIETSTVVTGYPFTLGAWTKALDGSSIPLALVSVSDFDVMYFINIDGGVTRIAARNTDFEASTGSTVLNDTWCHLCGVFESNTSRKLYLNGVLDATNTVNVSYNVGVDRICVGWLGDHTPSYNKCVVKSPCIFDYAMPVNQIRALANLTRPRGVAAI